MFQEHDRKKRLLEELLGEISDKEGESVLKPKAAEVSITKVEPMKGMEMEMEDDDDPMEKALAEKGAEMGIEGMEMEEDEDDDLKSRLKAFLG